MVFNWRRKFYLTSEKIGWVGNLEWLQRHNLLYGTELADPEDVQWWSQQRQTAPLDREVDPWGSAKLREHLKRMWYGQQHQHQQQQHHPQTQQQQLQQQQHTQMQHHSSYQ